MKNNEPKNAVIYARVSSLKQAKEGNGKDSQITRCSYFAQSRGLNVIATFTDDMTGSQVRRPGMDAMLGFLRQDKTQEYIVIIDDISRLARSLPAHLKLRDEIIKAGGILKSPSVSFGDNSDAQLNENMQASMAQYFSQKNREQMINRTTARLMDGYYVDSIPPRGYKYTHKGDNRIVRDEPLATIVQTALEGFASGRFGSIAEVRLYLQNQPEYPKPKSGEITQQRAKDTLKQVGYAGMVGRPSWDIPMKKGKHEPIISYETFLKIQDLLAGKARVTNRANISKDFILRGAVCCADCNNPLTASWSTSKGGKKHPYYLCFKKGCESYRKSIKRDVIEGEFAALMTQLQPSKSLFKVASRMFKDLWDYQGKAAQERLTGLENDLLKIEADQSKFIDRMVETDNSRVIERLDEKITQLDNQKLAIAEKLAKNGEPVRPFKEMFEHAMTFLANPCNIWENGTFAERRNILKMAFIVRLAYSRKDGFRTPKTSIPFKVLGGFLDDKREMAHWGCDCNLEYMYIYQLVRWSSNSNCVPVLG